MEAVCLLKNYYTEFDQSADEENCVIDSVDYSIICDQCWIVLLIHAYKPLVLSWQRENLNKIL